MQTGIYYIYRIDRRMDFFTFVAAAKGHKVIAELLIIKGADVNAMDDGKVSARLGTNNKSTPLKKKLKILKKK